MEVTSSLTLCIAGIGKEVATIVRTRSWSSSPTDVLPVDVCGTLR